MLKPLWSVCDARLTYFVTTLARVEAALFPLVGTRATYTAAVLGDAVVVRKVHGARGHSWEFVEASLTPLQIIGWC